ncbi:hypothetical protein ACQP2U_43700 (plasmid) [Nocardia sp. CA-084685]|uniref:hypothetical protein n=1 Tax=Nocardia sp. CA-084685 TaxID=3239970 RepID=UPI003D96EB8D
MTSDIDCQTVDSEVVDVHDKELQSMRYIWRSGGKTADTAAAELREVARTLNRLRSLPLPPLPSSDPTEWVEERVPDFPFTTDTVDQMFGTLIGHVQLMAYRYEEQGREITQSLAELDKPFQAPAELRGCMHDDYTSEKVYSVLSRLSAVSGLRIVCVWDLLDTYGYSGESAFYIQANNGEALHYLADQPWEWLHSPADDPDTPASPGEPATWAGAVVPGLTYTDLTGGHDLHNFAVHDNT